MHLSTGSLRSTNASSYYWTDTVYASSSYAYYFFSGNTTTGPSYNDGHWYGFAVQAENSPNSSIYLTRGGAVTMTTGSLRRAGSDGYYWGVSADQSELYAYFLNFNSANVVPSNNNARWSGFTVHASPTSDF